MVDPKYIGWDYFSKFFAQYGIRITNIKSSDMKFEAEFIKSTILVKWDERGFVEIESSSDKVIKKIADVLGSGFISLRGVFILETTLSEIDLKAYHYKIGEPIHV